MAVGTSSLNESAPASAFWDQNLSYSALGSALIPLGVLELHQIPGNPAIGPGGDYSGAFTTPPSGLNYIEVGRQVGGAIVFSSAGTRTIAGEWSVVPGGVVPGSYLIPPVAAYRYTISYRITPRLPVTFNGLMAVAQPGYYTMQIRYLLAVDQ
ncbi:MAG: hypothetical protein COB88_07430 [Flavobacteriales bacterium]|nr:MAG: hypothetical protein COB88_07430 [Flavobacteriales bacterium]